VRLRQTLAVTQLFLRRFAFHPMNLACIFLLPIVIALIFGAADEQALSQLPVGVVVVNANAQTKEYLAALDREPGVAVRVYSDVAALTRATRRADVSAGAVIDGTTRRIELMGDGNDAVFPATRAVITSVAARGSFSGDAPVTLRELATTKEARSTGRPRAAAGMLVYFLFVNGCFAAALLTEDRERGVVRRAASAPVSPNVFVFGEVFGRFLIVFVQGILIAAVSSLLLGATWGATLPFVAVVLVLAAVAAGASVLLGLTIVRPGPEGMAVAFALAAVAALAGGSFWSLDFVPPVMRVIAYATPNAWALRAIDELVARGEWFGAIAIDLVVLAGFAAAFLAIATFTLRRALLAPDGAA
jgi:ABC-type multidrug transport system permease subunit